jgi:hypothetical protein
VVVDGRGENNPSDSLFERGRGQGCGGGWKRSKRPPPTVRLAFGAREGARVWWWVERVKMNPSDSLFERGRGQGCGGGLKDLAMQMLHHYII